MKKAKKLISALLGLCLTVSGLTAIPANAKGVQGDIDASGKLGVTDLIALRRWLANPDEFKSWYYSSMYQWDCADLNGDGKLNVIDLALMKQKLTKNMQSLNPVYTANNLMASITAESAQGKEADENFIHNQTEFYLNLIQKTAKDGTNTLVSPYSLVQCLGMVANGADGQTLDEMQNVLGGGMSIDELNQYLYTQRTSQPDTENCKLRTANSIWYRDGGHLLSVEPDFLQINADYYGADAFKAPFDKTTAKDINKWCAFNTDNMITRLYDEKEPLPEYTVMTLINAVCFDAKWSLPYMEYQIHENDFTAFDGTVSQVDMMYESNTYRNSQTSYIEDENAVGFRKYYSDGKYAFVAMLPDEGISIDEYVSGLTADSVQETLTNFYTTDKKMILTTKKMKSFLI